MQKVGGENMADDHHSHGDHTHKHGSDCGHTAVPHEGHTDYLYESHLHHDHEGHYDEQFYAGDGVEPRRLHARP